MQHPSTGQIEVGGGRKIAHDELDLGSGIYTCNDRIENNFSVDVHQRCLGTECNNPTKRLVVGMSPDVRVCVGSGYMTQKRNMRSRHSHQEQQYRAQGSEQNAVENAESQYPAQSNRS